MLFRLGHDRDDHSRNDDRQRSTIFI